MRRREPLREIYDWLVEQGAVEFGDIVEDVVPVEPVPGLMVKVRVVFVDGSFLDIYWSPGGRYSLHYERRHIDGTLYRHDNAPHEKHRHIKTFPRHYHEGSEDNVTESHLPSDPVDAVREFLNTIRILVKRGA